LLVQRNRLKKRQPGEVFLIFLTSGSQGELSAISAVSPLLPFGKKNDRKTSRAELVQMVKKVLILHAWYNKPQDDWYPWLKMELERKGYEVNVPELPTMDFDLPSLEKLTQFVKRLIDEETIVVGHSLGGVLALRLGEKIKYRKMILVAGWDYDDLYPQHRLFWKNKINHDLIKKNIEERIVIHSDNDLYLTAFQAENMSKRLEGKFILVEGAGHFTKKDGVAEIPQILDFL